MTAHVLDKEVSCSYDNIKRAASGTHVVSEWNLPMSNPMF